MNPHVHTYFILTVFEEKVMEKPVKTIFHLLIGVCVIFNTLFATAQDFFIPENENLFVEIPTVWEEIDSDKRSDILRLLISTRQYNRNSIKTYSAKYRIEAILEASNEEKEAAISQKNEYMQRNDLYRYIDFTADIVSDVENQKTFRKIIYDGDTLKDSKGSVVFENVPLNTISVTDKYEYIRYQEQMTLTNIPELPNYTFNKEKFAWIDPPEALGKTNYLTLLDPFEYYDQKPWGFLEGVLDAMEGKDGKDEQERIDKIVTLYEATDKHGVKWFRFCERLVSPDGNGTVYLNNLAVQFNYFLCKK